MYVNKPNWTDIQDTLRLAILFIDIRNRIFKDHEMWRPLDRKTIFQERTILLHICLRHLSSVRGIWRGRNMLRVSRLLRCWRGYRYTTLRRVSETQCSPEASTERLTCLTKFISTIATSIGTNSLTGRRTFTMLTDESARTATLFYTAS